MHTPFLLGLMLGMRHGADSGHLTAIDGLSRIRTSPTNGVLFALGRGLVVTLLVVGPGHILADQLEPVGPWMLIFLGFANLRRLIRTPRPVAEMHRLANRRAVSVGHAKCDFYVLRPSSKLTTPDFPEATNSHPHCASTQFDFGPVRPSAFL